MTPFSVEKLRSFIALPDQMDFFAMLPNQTDFFAVLAERLRSRRADAAAANLFITPERSDQVLFSHPYYLCKTSCFSPAAH